MARFYINDWISVARFPESICLFFIVEPESSDWSPLGESTRSRKRKKTSTGVKKTRSRRSSSSVRGRGRGRLVRGGKESTTAVSRAMDAEVGGESLVGASEASSVSVCGSGLLAGSETEDDFGVLIVDSPSVAPLG